MLFNDILMMSNEADYEEKTKIIEKILEILPSDIDDTIFRVYNEVTETVFNCEKQGNDTVYVRYAQGAEPAPYTYSTYVVSERNETRVVQPDPILQKEENDLLDAHNASFSNGEAMRNRIQMCGCFCCQSIFSTAELTEVNFIKEQDSRTTVRCPRCGSDSVLHQDSGFPVTKEFMNKLNSRFM